MPVEVPMAEVAEKLMTVAEFLRWDDGSDRRYELVGGRPVMMAPPGRVHGVLVIRLGAEFRAQLPTPCQPQGEAGIVAEADDFSYFVADLAVSCAPLGPDPWCPEPVLIVEVLSDTTRGLDLGVKLPAYRRIPSVRHILLVETRGVRVEHWRRETDGWKVRDLGPGDVLLCDDLGIRLTVDALYEGLPIPPAPSAG
jgi:Uma2 family endonuclease